MAEQGAPPTRLAFLGLVEYCAACGGPPRPYLGWPRAEGEPLWWRDYFAADNLDPAPDDPPDRPLTDLPRFA